MFKERVAGDTSSAIFKIYKNQRGYKMKKVCILLVFCLVLISGCGSSSKRVNIVTSFYPMYIIALNLTDSVDDVSVKNMAENHTGCLHDFRIQSEDMKRIENADAFIINGAGMESFLDKVIESYPDIHVIDSSEGIEFIYDTHHHEEDSYNDKEDFDENHDVNPHIWVSISNYINQVENICRALSYIDPANREKYTENKIIYINKLQKLKTKMHSSLENLKTRDIITFHEAFPYFAKEFNLNIKTVINREPESEPSVKELSDTIEIVKQTGIKALFVEPQYPDTSAKTISKETGAKIYTLDPISSGEISKDAYINAMEKNLKVLEEALK